MKEEEFQNWLAESGAETQKGRNTRIHAIKTIERNLSELGFSWANLDHAWAEDRFESIRDRIRQLRDDAKAGGQDYRILMPASEKPLGRLSNFRSWLAQYGRFLDGDAASLAMDADRIRQHVLDSYIEPARETEESMVDVLVRDVNHALGLTDAWPNICQAMAGKKFLEQADVPPPERIGADKSSATLFRFDLSGSVIDRTALEQMRETFLIQCPDFKSFTDPDDEWKNREGDYKRDAAARVQTACKSVDDDQELGQAILDILKSPAERTAFVRWQTEDTIRKIAQELLNELYSTIGVLARSNEPISVALARAFAALEHLRKRGASPLTFGERINILFSTAGMVRPHEAAPFKITAINGAWKALTGRSLFVESGFDASADYARLSAGFDDILTVMRDEWNWAPKDWLDVQGFLWIAMEERSEITTVTNTKAETAIKQALIPTNLILYGPPGTGKTYTTIEEAVRLCGEDVPKDRTALTEIYNLLCKEERIEFVTFHQSMSYEDFVEGRQPVTDTDGDGTSNGGFSLETIPGIFRRISRRAETSRGKAAGKDAISVEGRQIFKMSIGEAANTDDAHLFDEAISGGYALLGFNDIDWSDPEFTDREAIIAACKEHSSEELELSAQSGQVQMPFIFRNWVNLGDLVIVSKGNQHFRAIGEFTGEYVYHPRPEGGYAHRREVRWLWVDRTGVPVSEVYSRRFSMKSVYLMYDGEVNIPALERYMNSQQAPDTAGPEPFVLIIDEINRANISKVFGELITLLEPDKRLGLPNQIKVRLPYSGDEFGVPANLNIVGTMNTADRSIALLDTALRRRFDFRELMPDPDVLRDAKDRCGVDLPRLLATLNERIEYLYDREHQIGHAYFVNCSTSADVDIVMRNKVIPLLAEYFFEDWAKVAVILGDAEPHDRKIQGGFLNRERLKAPPGVEAEDDIARFRWSVRSLEDGFDYTKLLGA